MARLPAEARTPYRGYARNIGLAFQIADDLIDHSGDEARGRQADRQGRARPARRRSSRCSATGARAAAGARAGRPGDRASCRPWRGGRPAARHRALRHRTGSLGEGDMAERIGVYPGTFDPITLGHSTSSGAARTWSTGWSSA